MGTGHDRRFRVLVVAPVVALVVVLVALAGAAGIARVSGGGTDAAGASPQGPSEVFRTDASGGVGTTDVDDGARRPRILLVGDSITQGMAGDHTWRYRAYQELRAQGVDPDLVGYRTDTVDPITKERIEDYADPDFDRDHAGVAGMTAVAPQYDVAALTAATRPDVVVVSLGVNDVLQGHDPDDVAAALRALVDAVRSAAPHADLVLAEQTTTWLGGVPALNERIRALVDALDTERSRVALARVPEGYDAVGDTWDGIHPNAVGEIGIAHEVVAALSSLGYAEKPAAVRDLPAPGPERSVVGARVVGRTPTSLRLAWTLPRGVTTVRIEGRDLGTGGRWTPLATSAWGVEEQLLEGFAPGQRVELRLRPARGTALSDERWSTTLTTGTPTR